MARILLVIVTDGSIAAACRAQAPADSGVVELPVQRDIMDVLKYVLHRPVEPSLQGEFRRGLAWTILPTITYNPVYGLAAGASVSAAGKLGSDPAARTSALSISGNYSTSGQLQLQFKGDIFTGSGNYLVKADVRYLDTERSTWGLGPMVADQPEYPMAFKLVRLYGTLYRHTGGAIYVGLGIHDDVFTDIYDERAAQGESTPFTEYSGGAPTDTRATGVSINLLGDTRDNPVNPMEGLYISGSFRDYLERLGADKNWQEFLTDVRIYPRLPRGSRNVLAFWISSWMTFGPAPYLDLPAIGWDTYGRGGRGYLQGRIRGQNQVYLETEYRMQLSRDGLLGAVVFLNAMMTTVPGDQTFGPPNKGAGLGLRIKFNKHSNTNLTLDHGWGEEGSGGWFLGTTEVF